MGVDKKLAERKEKARQRKLEYNNKIKKMSSENESISPISHNLLSPQGFHNQFTSSEESMKEILPVIS